MRKCLIGIALAGMLLAVGPFASAQETPAASSGRTGFFIQAQGGLSFFLKKTFDTQRVFDLYGEAGSLAESYTFGTAVPVDFSVGYYFHLWGTTLKGGLGFNNLFRSDTGTITAVIPHPFEFNQPRTAVFPAGDLSNKSMSFYVYGLFSLVDTGTVSLWLGPMIGIGLETFNTLDNFTVDEKPPFTSADLTIRGLTYTEDSFASLWFGAGLDFEYALSPKFRLVASGKLVYDNPQIANAGHRANFLQAQVAVGFRLGL